METCNNIQTCTIHLPTELWECAVNLCIGFVVFMAMTANGAGQDNRCPIVEQICLRGNVFTEPLPSNESIRHNI
jgi:hypothetical protein